MRAQLVVTLFVWSGCSLPARPNAVDGGTAGVSGTKGGDTTFGSAFFAQTLRDDPGAPTLCTGRPGSIDGCFGDHDESPILPDDVGAPLINHGGKVLHDTVNVYLVFVGDPGEFGDDERLLVTFIG